MSTVWRVNVDPGEEPIVAIRRSLEEVGLIVGSIELEFLRTGRVRAVVEFYVDGLEVVFGQDPSTKKELGPGG